MPPSKIMLIRHGEKPDKNGEVLGVTESGSPDREELIVQGWQRAGALVRRFAPDIGSDPKIARPKILFAPKPNQIDSSVRAQHTIGPLAKLLGDANIEFGVGDEKKLSDAILQLNDPVLVAWEHKHIKDIVANLTNGAVKSPHWPKERFDMIFVLTPSPRWTLQQVPQMVLPEDSDTQFDTGAGPDVE
jgi:hypothetical protein